MNRNEVKVWLKYHGEVFPEFQTWYDGQKPAARGRYFEACTKAFRKIELEDASGLWSWDDDTEIRWG